MVTSSSGGALLLFFLPKKHRSFFVQFRRQRLLPILLFIIFFSLLQPATAAHHVFPSTFRLVGGLTSNSYAQYAPWHPCLNGTLQFEFKTSDANGLLVYAQ